MSLEAFAQALARETGAAKSPERVVTRCFNCGARFDRRLNRRRHFCSVKCRYAWHALGRVQPRLDFGR